jgi:hypothetical protein
MSKFIEYKGNIFKISNKMLNTFQNFSIEQQTKAQLLLCKYLLDFITLHNTKNKIQIEHTNISYFSNIIDFSKYDKKFREKLINRVIIYINNTETKFNSNNIFTKLCDVLED